MNQLVPSSPISRPLLPLLVYLPSLRHQPTRRTRRNLPPAQSWPSFKHLIVRQEIGAKTVGTRSCCPLDMADDLAQKVAPRYLFVCPTVGVAASPYKCSQYDISCSPRGQGGDSSTHGSCYISGTRFSMHGRQNFLQHIINGSSSLCSQHTSLLCPSLLLSVSDHRSFVERFGEQQSRRRWW